MHMRTFRRNHAVGIRAAKGLAVSAAAGSACVALAAAAAPGRPAVAASATATPSPRPGFKNFVVPQCLPGVYYTISYHRPVDMFVPRLEYIDGPGGEMEVWLKRFYLIRFHARLEREVEGDFDVQKFT